MTTIVLASMPLAPAAAAFESWPTAAQLAGLLDHHDGCPRDLFGGVLPATMDRLPPEAPQRRLRRRARHGQFSGAADHLEKYRGRLFYNHNPNVTLMRTTRTNAAPSAKLIGERLS